MRLEMRVKNLAKEPGKLRFMVIFSLTYYFDRFLWVLEYFKIAVKANDFQQQRHLWVLYFFGWSTMKICNKPHTLGAELVWVCTLMSPQFDFWYCKYDYGGSFIKRWHAGIYGRLDGILV